jgi:2-hydroxycyclohexanecarboxyl-CoA dehydrogenase
MKLKDRVALVTGGGSGLGRAISLLFAEEGAHVVVNEPHLENAKQTVVEMKGPGGGRAIQADVADSAQVKAMFATIEREIGTLDILVNNAGTDEFGFFVDTTPEQWQKVIAVNLNGVLNCTHAALPGMQSGGYGRIVNIASEAGRIGSKGSAVYSAAKGGVIAFTKVTAREGARFGINANGIAPGPIETPLLMRALEFGEIGEKIVANMKAGTQLRRLGSPDEVAAVVAFLASDDASYVTGEIIGVSGGMGMVG